MGVVQASREETAGSTNLGVPVGSYGDLTERSVVVEGSCPACSMREDITLVCCAASDERLQLCQHGQQHRFLSRAQRSPASREPAPDTSKVSHANAFMVALAGEVWA